MILRAMSNEAEQAFIEASEAEVDDAIGRRPFHELLLQQMTSERKSSGSIYVKPKVIET